KSGQAKAAKKAGRIAAEGVILTKTEGNVGTLVELNCETDFVARDDNFLSFGEKVIAAAFANKETDVEKLKAVNIGDGTIDEVRESLVAKIRSEEHTSELQSRENLVCRLLLEKKKKKTQN